MKNIKLICSFVLLLAVTISCSIPDGIDQNTMVTTTASSKLAKIFDITSDNSGNVKITPTGEGVISYTIKFGHGTGTSAQAVVSPGESITHSYPEGSYTVAIVSTDAVGKQITNSYPLVVTYVTPTNLIATLTQSGLNLKVKATAIYAASYLVYFGDVANEVGTPLAKDVEIAHNYAAIGNYNVKVVALSGGAATAQVIKPITVTVPFGLTIDFENVNVNYFFGTFGGGQAFATVANPNAAGLNLSAKVGKFTRGWEAWSGTYSPLDLPIDFAVGKKIKALIYNPNPALIGAKVNVELEGAGNPLNGVAVLKMPVTKSGVWEEIEFDFSGISGIPAGAKFTQLVLRFNDGADGAAGIGGVFYIDNIRLTN